MSFTLRVTCPRGSLLVGGYTAEPDGVDAIHAQDQHGKPLIPATALRGALRETLEALLRADGQLACSGGDGRTPGTPQEKPISCTLLDGGPCRACRLFGTQRARLGKEERAFSALILGDATFAGQDAPWGMRYSVTLDRKRKSAKEGLLFDRLAPLPGDHLVFEAEGELLDPSFETELKAAIALTQHLGGGRSRGQGRVDLEFLPKAREATPLALKASDALRLIVTLKQPACIGVPIARDNLRMTRKEIPGSALRGAIGFALAAVLEKPNDDQAFQALVAESGARFGFLYPGQRSLPWVGPWPLTARGCKQELSHPRHDVLQNRIALAYAKSPEAALALDQIKDCPTCHAPLKAARDLRGETPHPKTRVVDRVALDRRRRSARDEQLFSYELLETEQVFVGEITHIPSDSWPHLMRALSLPLSLGRGRSMGWGRISVEALPVPQRESLTDRGKRFEYQLKKYAPKAPARQLVALTLLSPLIPPQGDEDGVKALAAALGVSADACVTKARRFGLEGGWDQRNTPDNHPTSMRQSVAAGAVFVFDLGRPWDKAEETLKALERDGVGEWRHQGFGRVLCFDPALLETSTAAKQEKHK